MLAGEPAGHDKKTALAATSLTAAALVVAITVAWQSATVISQDLAFTAAETELSFWGRDNYQPADSSREDTQKVLETLLAAAPNHPDYLALKAYHEAWRAYSAYDPRITHMHVLRAMRLQLSAQEARPAYRQGWVKLVEYARRAGGYKEVGPTLQGGASEMTDLTSQGTKEAELLGSFAQQRLDALQPDPMDGA